jgi:Bifunctional DNA primase/polymerase, N-terminal/AAA domain/Primase C terminal 1 (PriCT-1)
MTSGAKAVSIVTENAAIQQLQPVLVRGFRIFPCRPRSKTPQIPKWQAQATSDPDQIGEWQEEFPGANWAVACGQSGLVVLDIDVKKLKNGSMIDGRPWFTQQVALHGDTLSTLSQRTGSGAGMHLFFNAPDAEIRNSAGKIAEGIDIRGQGGYALIPPSLHPSGGRYQWSTPPDHEIRECPAFLVELATNAQPAPVTIATTSGGERIIREGKRNDSLFRLACSMRKKGLPRETIELTLADVNQRCCQPPLPAGQVAKIVTSAMQYTPSPPRPMVSIGSGRSQAMTPSPEAWSSKLIYLDTVAAKPVAWLWEPYIPFGMIAMITGDPGAGKTYIGMSIAADVTRGRVPISGERREPENVLFLTVENPADYILRPRFDALGGDPKRFAMLVGAEASDGGAETKGVTLADVELLRDALRKTKAKFAVIDPLQSYLGTTVDAHRANETRPILDGLARVAAEFNTAMVIMRHAGKAGASRALYRGLGSIDFTGAARTEMLAGETPEGLRALVHIKTNIGRVGSAQGYEISPTNTEGVASPVGFFRWTGVSPLTSADITAPEVERADSAAGEAREFLTMMLANGPKLVKEIEKEAKSAGISEMTLRRAKDKLQAESRKRLGDGLWEWAFPPQDKQRFHSADEHEHLDQLADPGALNPHPCNNLHTTTQDAQHDQDQRVSGDDHLAEHQARPVDSAPQSDRDREVIE